MWSPGPQHGRCGRRTALTPKPPLPNLGEGLTSKAIAGRDARRCAHVRTHRVPFKGRPSCHVDPFALNWEAGGCSLPYRPSTGCTRPRTVRRSSAASSTRSRCIATA